MAGESRWDRRTRLGREAAQRIGQHRLLDALQAAQERARQLGMFGTTKDQDEAREIATRVASATGGVSVDAEANR